MSLWWIGAALGLLAGLSVLMAARYSPPMRPIKLTDRIAPYLADTPPPSRLLASKQVGSEPLHALRKVLGPVIGDAVRWVDRIVGGGESVRRRLGGLNSSTTVEEFRIEQIVWGALGMVAGAVAVCVCGVIVGSADPILVIVAAVGGGIAGTLGRDWWLTRQLARRERLMLAEFPVVADLLALAVTAGEAPIDAIQRVCRLTKGELSRDLAATLDEARAGAAVVTALTALSLRTTLDPLSRFVDGLVVAIERGTPLADVLRAQAADVREHSKRALLDAGGRKEVQMMVPVVFMILPVTVLFALYPGLLTLVSLSR